MVSLHGHWDGGEPMTVQPESECIRLIGLNLRYTVLFSARGNTEPAASVARAISHA